ncbi:unnamed protein product [Arctogadus glacialis]
MNVFIDQHNSVAISRWMDVEHLMPMCTKKASDAKTDSGVQVQQALYLEPGNGTERPAEAEEDEVEIPPQREPGTEPQGEVR